MGGLSLLLAMVASCPFERQTFVVRVMTAAAVLAVCVAIGVFTEMERNEVLSCIHGTTPGAISSPLLLRLVLFVVLPLLGAAAANFPALGDRASSWLGSLLRLMQ